MTASNNTNEGTIGEIRMVTFDFAPEGWAQCNGAIQSISDNTTLFSILGTTYGGDGRVVFGLPDLRGRIPLSSGKGVGLLGDYELGQRGGAETEELSVSMLPEHTHVVAPINQQKETAMPCSDLTTGNVSSPSDAYPAGASAMYSTESPDTQMGAANVSVSNSSLVQVSDTGGGQSHNNMQPFLVVNYIICISGTYPTRNS